jgi:hypothetical protein
MILPIVFFPEILGNMGISKSRVSREVKSVQALAWGLVYHPVVRVALVPKDELKIRTR